MSIPRLSFLYPQFLRSPKAWDAFVSTATFTPSRKSRQANLFHDSSRRRQDAIAQRYGPAQEPSAPPVTIQGAEKSLPPPKKIESTSTDTKRPQSEGAKGGSKDASRNRKQAKSESQDTAFSDPDGRTRTIDSRLDLKNGVSELPTSSSLSPSEQEVPQQLEKVLHMEPPSAIKPEDTKHYLSPTPYVHHFDTYTLVKDLSKNGFTDHQSVTIMKAVRGLLATNLDRAKEGLVSKSS
jgi:hypothetical protein